MWCWAACSSVVLHYYGIAVCQCEIADWVRQQSGWGTDFCCDNPGGPVCNRGNPACCGVGSGTSVLQHWGVENYSILAPLSEDVVAFEIGAGRPFLILWAWTGTPDPDDGHELVGYGVDGDWVNIMDPWPPGPQPPNCEIVLYDWLVGGGSGDLAHAWVESIRMTTDPVGVVLEVEPGAGPAPLDADLTAEVSGGIAGQTINYSFWWDCAYAGAWVDEAIAQCGDPGNPMIGQRLEAQYQTLATVIHTYPLVGTYTAKVIVERGSARPAEMRRTITVVPPSSMLLSVTKLGVGAGTVTSAPPAIHCDPTCAANFPFGSEVTLTASAEEGSTFTGWSGACAGGQPVEDTYLGWTRSQGFRLGRGLSGPIYQLLLHAGIMPGCYRTFSGLYEYASSDYTSLARTWHEVRLQLADGTEWPWNRDASQASGDVLATFETTDSFDPSKYYQLWGNGSCGGYWELRGTEAISGQGFLLDSSWDMTRVPFFEVNPKGTGQPSVDTCTLVLDSPKSVTAWFSAPTHSLTVTKTGTGTGTVTSLSGEIDCGVMCRADFTDPVEVTLTASASPGWVFARWTGACAGLAVCQVTMSQDRDVVAYFVDASGAAGFAQLGNKLIGLGSVGMAFQGDSGAVDVSADGTTAIVGGHFDADGIGAAWVFSRPEGGGVWTQQGDKLVGTGMVGRFYQGRSVAISADGNTAIVGGVGGEFGAAWVFTRSAGVWTQQQILIGSGGVTYPWQGHAVALSADGNTALVGGPGDNNHTGAVWVFTRTDGVWTQQGEKLVGSGAVGAAQQGYSVAISGDGGTAVVGGPFDNCSGNCWDGIGAVWVFRRSGSTWVQQGEKVVGAGAIGASMQGVSLAIAADGGSLIVGASNDDPHDGGAPTGASWVFIRAADSWVQQAKLVGDTNGGERWALQGASVAMSANGDTTLVGGPHDNYTGTGAAWVFARSGGAWAQLGARLVGSGAVGNSEQGTGVALSAAGDIAFVAGKGDHERTGATWVFTRSPGLPSSTLTVSSSGTGSGTVASDPAGIDCGDTCSASFPNNTVVTLTAAAATDSTFTGWSGEGCAGTGTCQVTMTQARAVTATFTLSSYALTVSRTGTGSGTVTSDPGGVDCGATCSAEFTYNTAVTLTAAAATGSTFTEWSGEGCAGTGTCQVTMTQARSVTATFTLNSYALAVSKTGAGSGTVASAPAGIDCGATCSADFSYNTTVTLTAAATTGSTFTGWSGEGCAGTGACQVTMTQARAVTATFALNSYALAVSKTGAGSGTVASAPAGIDCGATCSAEFLYNTAVSLAANAASGSVFSGWSAEGCSGIGSCQVTMTQARNVTATFTLRPAGTDTAGIYRSSDRSWYLHNSNAGGFAELVFPYGDPSDLAVKGDWDGDGMDTVGIYRDGTFYLKNTNEPGNADLVVGFGVAGDLPIAGDWDGDGIDTIGIYRPAEAAWFLRNSNTSGAPDISFTYGLANEAAVAGDWDGDGIDTVGIFRASDRQWYLHNSNAGGNAELVFPYGDPAMDVPVVGDWDGTGTDTVGIYRASLGEWFLRNSNTAGNSDLNFTYGLVNEKPLAGDWDGL
ncbi:MAG: hypothetical protein HY825_15730 [Acidobacteria bacterium]|nr:hypothetical protein [Acidobacteriota bacterium]